jgi:hypothetical protein
MADTSEMSSRAGTTSGRQPVIRVAQVSRVRRPGWPGHQQVAGGLRASADCRWRGRRPRYVCKAISRGCLRGHRKTADLTGRFTSSPVPSVGDRDPHLGNGLAKLGEAGALSITGVDNIRGSPASPPSRVDGPDRRCARRPRPSPFAPDGRGLQTFADALVNLGSKVPRPKPDRRHHGHAAGGAA